MHEATSTTLEHTDRSVSTAPPSLLRRAGFLAHAVVSYLVGVSSLVGLILFTLGVLDPGAGALRVQDPLLALGLDLGLLVAFGLQHSVMARAGFKERWTRLVPPALERATYVLATGVALWPALVLWQPVPGVLWSVSDPLARTGLSALAVLGWAYLLAASFAINHFELFGLEQAWRAFRGQAPRPVPFRERWMYRFDRHPIMTGLLVGLWATPDLTAGRLLLSAGLTVYVMVGVHFEERALRRQWGETYEDYRRRVRSIVPLPWSSSSARRTG